MSKEETDDFYERVKSFKIFLVFNGKEIDLSNISEPIQDFSEVDYMQIQRGSYSQRTVEMRVNKFYDDDSQIGFLPSNVDPFNFLTKDTAY